MKKYSALVLATLSLTIAEPLLAFLAPTDMQEGVTLLIEGFEESSTHEKFSARQIPTDKPLEYTVKLTNKRNSDIIGKLKTWLNDDWLVSNPDPMTIAVPAGQTATINFSATAKPSVLGAIYPIHAAYTLRVGAKEITLHPIAIFETLHNPVKKPLTSGAITLRQGIQRLDANIDYATFYNQKGGAPVALDFNFNGADAASGTHNSKSSVTRGGITRAGFAVHPPWRNGHGTTWIDFKLQMPNVTPLTLNFHTAIRDSMEREGKSDGTEHKVFVILENGESKELFSRFSDSKVWEAATVDLAAFAGQQITLRLWTGPGPHNNTSCDQCYWGDPLLAIGSLPAPLTESALRELKLQAITRASAAAVKKPTSGSGAFQLDVRGERFGVAVVPGSQGLTDGVIAFSDGTRHLVYHGFKVEIDSAPVGAVANGQPVMGVTVEHASRGRWIVNHNVAMPQGQVNARATVSANRGALQITWEMPDAQRDNRGTPRYTRLSIGAADGVQLWRAYAGFGNVMENPGAFTLGAGGFSSSTRHVGADYNNGLSLVQACDIFPDRLTFNPDQQHFALETHHDATFMLLPSGRGAFAAARAYSDITGFKEGKGMKMLAGRMCIDQWGGDYADAAKGLREAGRYGLHNAIFVKHVWQRWGYDYRLPEIYPPAGDNAAFLDMRNAAREAGMLFCPHDNYIDFYPDAEGYSYDHIVFRESGQPVRAWYNQGRRAQSYRWQPHAFRPWMESNMRAMRDGFAPESLFIDVFTAIAPFDYYDRNGTFYPKMRTQKEWCDAFDTCRNILKRGGIMISEAGTDALIGAVDGAQADHFVAERWVETFSAAERVPWHDMASHGRMVLFAGGLGHRYSALNWERNDRPHHGYGSDDYLSNTVLGGRNPMCDGPFSRRTVMTYWLLHDVCEKLASATFESHLFGTSIHQQHTTFSNSGKVWANRGSNIVWRIKATDSGMPHEVVLPQYGFLAVTPEAQAGVVLLDGQRAAFARSPTAFFVDARPPHDPLRTAAAESAVTNGKYLGKGEFEIEFDWNILIPEALENYVVFLHVCHNEVGEGGEKIVFQPDSGVTPGDLAKAGRFKKVVRIKVPERLPAGEYRLLYGIYKPGHGERMYIRGIADETRRIIGGSMFLTKSDSAFSEGSFQPKLDSVALEQGLNTANKMLNFGAITANGAFRLLHASKRSWRIIPLPGSRGFKVELDLAALGAAKRVVKQVVMAEPFNVAAQEPEWQQQGTRLKISCDADSFAYDIEF